MSAAEYALLVAGGSGTRMQSPLPKQFLPLNGKPILMHTIQAFFRYSSAVKLIVVLPSYDIQTWHDLCKKHHFNTPHQVTAGGIHRTESVRKGLQMIEGQEGFVAIHDGVRPLVSPQLIANSFAKAREKGNAVAAVPLKESIRSLKPNGHNAAEDRNSFRLIQTPQTFKVALIKRAYAEIPSDRVFSDDASVVEQQGEVIYLIEGEYRNIKITTPEDLNIAEIFLEQTSAMQ